MAQISRVVLFIVSAVRARDSKPRSAQRTSIFMGDEGAVLRFTAWTWLVLVNYMWIRYI